VQETLDQSIENRRAWVYNPGQRRVRRAPNVAFDNPGTNSDNLRTSDQFDMYNGSPERYDWTLVGKKEMLVPYNAYKLDSNTLKYSDVLKKNHINSGPGALRAAPRLGGGFQAQGGKSHLYSRRTLYVDEDSWQILAVDCYDSRGQLYRVQEGHVINFYEVPALWTVLETVYDLSNGRYLALGLDNEEARGATSRRSAPSPTTSPPPCSGAACADGGWLPGAGIGRMRRGITLVVVAALLGRRRGGAGRPRTTRPTSRRRSSRWRRARCCSTSPWRARAWWPWVSAATCCSRTTRAPPGGRRRACPRAPC
jgi:hypothetical protein